MSIGMRGRRSKRIAAALLAPFQFVLYWVIVLCVEVLRVYYKVYYAIFGR